MYAACTEDFKPVITRAALALQKKNKSAEFQAVVFKEQKPQDKTDADNAKDNEAPVRPPKQQDQRLNKPDQEFDIKKARHEILNFAMNNQRVIKNQKRMQIFQLVKLGADPPRKKYKNYKQLVEERQRLKKVREERKKYHQLGKNQTGLASVKCRSKSKLEKEKKKRAPVTAIDQNYGVVKTKIKKKK